jgi:uncharacterized membrane protein YjfL (UPF0719 family)
MTNLLSTSLPNPLVAEIFGDDAIRDIIGAVIYSLLGVLLFALIWFLIVKISPFSIRKEIEDDQNTALGIILGAVIIGIALIIAAAVHG